MNTRTIASMIIAAIDKGAPLYNAGNTDGCYQAYKDITTFLLSKDIDEYSKVQLTDALDSVQQPSATTDQKAWVLRTAFDNILNKASAPSSSYCSSESFIQEALDMVSFDSPSECRNWSTIHDSVMGGVSSGELIFKDDLAVFVGIISTEYNGGFASIRRKVNWNGTAYKGIFIDVMTADNPGRVFSLNIKDQMCVAFGGVNFKTKFSLDKAGTPTRIFLPFDKFSPEFRGRPVQVDPLAVANIVEISVMTMKPAGKFSLQLLKIGFY